MRDRQGAEECVPAARGIEDLFRRGVVRWEPGGEAEVAGWVVWGVVVVGGGIGGGGGGGGGDVGEKGHHVYICREGEAATSDFLSFRRGRRRGGEV